MWARQWFKTTAELKPLFIAGNECFLVVASTRKWNKKSVTTHFFGEPLEIFHVPPEEFRNHRTRIVISNFTERKIVKMDDALHYHPWQKIPVGPVPAAAPSRDQQWLATAPDKDERAVCLPFRFPCISSRVVWQKFSWRAENGNVQNRETAQGAAWLASKFIRTLETGLQNATS
jgi:hypothetical protein